MAFEIAENSLQETCFVLAIVGVVLAVAAVILRFIAVRKADRSPGWEDWFSVMALFFFIVYVIPLIYLLSVMNGKSKWAPADVVRIKKAGYAMGPQFCMNQMFAKLSLCFLYYRIFHVKQAFVYWVWGLGVAQVMWSIATYIAHYLECIPVAKDWDPTLPGTCINESVFLAAGETPNSLIDFALIALALWMIQSLKIEFSAKMKLFLIFILGGLAGILGFVKIGYGFSATSKAKVELLDPIWATVQQTCSVICCCAPVYRPIIPQLGIFSSLRSLGSSLFSRRSRSSNRTYDNEQTAGATVEANDSRGEWRHQPSKTWVELDEGSSKASSSRNHPV